MCRRTEGGSGGDHVVDDEDRDRSPQRTRSENRTAQSFGAPASGLGRPARTFQQTPTGHAESPSHLTSQEFALVEATTSGPARRRGCPRDDVEARRVGIGDDVGHQSGGQSPRDSTPGPILEPGDHLAHRSVVHDGRVRTRARRGASEHGTLGTCMRCTRCTFAPENSATDATTDGDEHITIRPWGCGEVATSPRPESGIQDITKSRNHRITGSVGNRDRSTSDDPPLSPTPSARSDRPRCGRR